MLKTLELLRILQSNSSKNFKEEFIRENKENKLFMDTLVFLCNPYIVTNLSDKKIGKKVKISDDFVFIDYDYKHMLDFLAERCTGTDAHIAMVQHFLNNNLENKDILEQIFIKNLKLGITSKTVNKAVPNLIPSFDVMLAESYEKNLEIPKNKEVIVSLKLDGTRIIAINKGGSVSFFSRQGQPIEGLVDIEPEFKKLKDGVYDGELIATGTFSTSKERFQATMKRSRVKGDKTGLEMICFDYIENVDDFMMHGECKTPCTIRKSTLSNLIGDGLSYIKYLQPLYQGVFDEVELKAIMDAVVAQDEEGLMINIADATYRCKRVKTLLKVKEFYTVDLKIVGTQEGTNRNTGKLGALIVDYKGHEVGVGSGFDDYLRETLWRTKEELIGKIVEVRYFEETTNQEGGISLRFPTFIRIRDDKSEPSLH